MLGATEAPASSLIVMMTHRQFMLLAASCPHPAATKVEGGWRAPAIMLLTGRGRQSFTLVCAPLPAPTWIRRFRLRCR